ncbi:hypothetical protein B0O99DRAFT_615393 [Bisporella sp. PMI_857]|nr:hypothetical protein B0O99DRAFT_615393 [Bisporella sp. PMI_857]
MLTVITVLLAMPSKASEGVCTGCRCCFSPCMPRSYCHGPYSLRSATSQYTISVPFITPFSAQTPLSGTCIRLWKLMISKSLHRKY